MIEPRRERTEPPSEVAALLEEGLRLHAEGRLESAEAIYSNVLEQDPTNFTATHCLGVIASQRFRYEEAVHRIEAALRLNPRSAMAHLNIGIALGQLGRFQEALIHYKLSLLLNPEFPDTYMNRGVALHALHRHEEALASYDRALALKPDFALAHSNKIFTLDFLPDLGFEAHQEERRRYFEMQARNCPRGDSGFPNDRDPARPLVVGYVSADFKRHSAASCFGPVLRHHDKAGFKIICYSGVRVEDDWTEQFRRISEGWRSTAGQSDDELSAQIRQDAVDILVDLSGHTEGNRMLVFARKPAPIQVTAWGHGGGTGLPTIDYQFTDPVHTPAWARHLFAEASYDLPCCITFDPPELAPPIAAVPAFSRGRITFGSLNRVIKMTPPVRDLWIRILQAVSGSKLLLKDAKFDDPNHREALWAVFSERGIPPERIELRGFTSHEGHLAACGEVDIGLDTFPQNGGITTWESLWMGTPVIAMLGNKPPSRISGAILHALGLDEWIAENEEDYFTLAVQKAADLSGLARFRQGIRARIDASPAGNPGLYTRRVEDGYRMMWNHWLQGNGLQPRSQGGNR